MKVSELEGAELDYWTIKAEGGDPESDDYVFFNDHYFVRSQKDGRQLDCICSWQCFGPIIEREKIELVYAENEDLWLANSCSHSHQLSWTDKNILVAAMRCYVASKFGEEIKNPLNKE